MLHISPAISEPCRTVSTHSWLVRWTRQFSNFEGTFADGRLTEVAWGLSYGRRSQGSRGCL